MAVSATVNLELQGGCVTSVMLDSTITLLKDVQVRLKWEQYRPIERGRAKYCDLSVESRSIILRLQQIIYLLATDKSQSYFAITKFNNCFVVQPPSLFWFFFFLGGGEAVRVHCWQKSIGFLFSEIIYSSVVTIVHEQNICSKNAFTQCYAWADYYL